MANFARFALKGFYIYHKTAGLAYGVMLLGGPLFMLNSASLAESIRANGYKTPISIDGLKVMLKRAGSRCLMNSTAGFMLVLEGYWKAAGLTMIFEGGQHLLDRVTTRGTEDPTGLRSSSWQFFVVVGAGLICMT